MTSDFLTAAADAVRSRDPVALQCAIVESPSNKQTTQHQFREELPMLLDPPDLLWLLQEITSPDDFARRRDIMLDSLSEDLCRNGYVPGIHFTVFEDDDAGKIVNVASAVWAELQQHLSPRALQHYRCFVQVRED